MPAMGSRDLARATPVSLHRIEQGAPVAQMKTAAMQTRAEKMVSAAAAERWIERGFFPVPVPYRRKGPTLAGWQDLRIGRDDLAHYFNSSPQNIGVLLGDDRGSADVDLDCPEALAVAPEFLPDTGLKFGRESKPASHWFYFCDPPIRSRKFADPVDKHMIVELRCQTAGGKIGLQTIVPPSVHEGRSEEHTSELQS